MIRHRAFRLAASLLWACPWALGGVIDFDDLPPGQIPATMGGVTFAPAPWVVNVRSVWKQPTATPSQAVYVATPTPLSVSFDNPVGRVRVCVGNPEGGNKVAATVRAFASGPGGYVEVGKASVALGADQRGITVPLEISRPQLNDIRKVEILTSSASYTVIDHLEYEPLGVSPGQEGVTTLDFDTLAAGTAIVDAYPGVPGIRFIGRPVVTPGGGFPGGVSSPPNVLQMPSTHEIYHDESMVIQFDPPQGYVALDVGNPYANTVGPMRVALRAFSDVARLNEVGGQTVSFTAAAAIRTRLEVGRWSDRDIAAIELTYRDDRYGYREVIDSLLYGPNRAGAPADSEPPVVQISSPPDGTNIVQLSPNETVISLPVWGTVSDNAGMSSVVLVSEYEGTGIRFTNGPAFLNPVPGAVRQYTFNGTAEVRQGRTIIHAYAYDTALPPNVAHRQVSVNYGLLNPQVTSVSPDHGYVTFTAKTRDTWHEPLEMRSYGNPITVRGRDLHQHVHVRLVGAGVVVQPQEQRAADGTSIEVSVPDWVYYGGADPAAAGGTWGLEVIETYPNCPLRVISSTPYRVIPPKYPQLYGFGFQNEGDDPSWGEFFGAFGDNVYWGWPWCARGPLARALYYPAYEYVMSKMASAGSCVGMSATSLLYCYSYDQPGRLVERVVYPVGCLDSGKPASYVFPDCDPGYPNNIWGFIRGNHAVQMSAEVVNVVMDQITSLRVSGTSVSNVFVSGDPLARLRQITDYPLGYVACIVPRIGEGHAVVPYAVSGNRIYVYDSNKPYNLNQHPESPANAAALNSYIDIDPIRNEFYFPNLNWRGTIMLALPIEIWRHPRTSIGLWELGRAYNIVSFGSVDTEVASEGGDGSIGWGEDGAFNNTLPGAIPFPLLNGADGAIPRGLPLLVPTNYPGLSVQCRNRGGDYSLFAAYGRRTLQVKVFGAPDGSRDELRIIGGEQRLAGMAFSPKRAGARFVPMLGVAAAGGGEKLFQYGALDVPADGQIEFAVSPGEDGAELSNRSGLELHPVLYVETLTPAGLGSRFWFEPIALAPGAIVRTVMVDPLAGQLRVETDLNGDGTPETTDYLNGHSPRIEDNPAEADRNANGIVDRLDVALGNSADVNGDGLPDEIQTPGVTFTAEDGDWSAKQAILPNTPEAELMVRAGDIDNLGYGWPPGFNPFSGLSTPPHEYPWPANPAEPGGTDRIMVGSSYRGQAPFGEDGYTAWTTRPENAPRPTVLDYADHVQGLTVTSALLQMFVDDFQAPTWGSRFVAFINGVRAPFLEEVLNRLDQTGPVGKVISVVVPESFLPQVRSGTLSVFIDDPETGAGDGFAIDFIKLLVNARTLSQTTRIMGTVTDADTGLPVPGAGVFANNVAVATTSAEGAYTLNNVPAGLVVLRVIKEGYTELRLNRDVVAGVDAHEDLVLQPVPQADLAVSIAADTTPVPFGGRFTFTMTLANNGPEAVGEVAVAATLPRGASLVSTAFTQGELRQQGDALGLVLPELGVGASASLTVELTIGSKDPAWIEVIGMGPVNDLDWSNNRTTITVPVIRPGGGVFVSGHDADYHSVPETTGNVEGAQRLIRAAAAYVTHNMAQPRTLFVTDVRPRGPDYADPRPGVIAALGLLPDVADYGSGTEGTLDLHAVRFEDYDLVIVASDFGGYLRQEETAILTQRSGELLEFVNHGGGLVVFAESESASPYGFLPFVRATVAGQPETGFALAALGAAMGLQASDVNGNYAHAVLELAPGFEAVDLDASGRVVSIAMRDKPLTPAGANAQADLAVGKSVSAETAFVGESLTYTLTVSNLGPDSATEVTVTDRWFGLADLVSVTASQGRVLDMTEADTVTCELGQLAAGQSATVTLELRPTSAGALENNATVQARENDPAPDNNAALVSSAIVVLNTPPLVRLVGPRDGAYFLAPANMLIRAEASDMAGQVVELRVYADELLIGVLTSEPFEMLWQEVPAGQYVLRAEALDDGGFIGTSEAVTVEVVARTPNGRVAVVAPVVGAETIALQLALSELGLTSDVYGLEGLSFIQLKDYSLVIWDDSGASPGGPDDNAVGVFHSLFAVNAPLYLIGSDLAAAAPDLSEARRADWTDLIHVTLVNPAFDATGFTVANPAHPVINGPFGQVAAMDPGGLSDEVWASGADEVVLGQMGNSPALLAVETPGGGRILTQLFLVNGGSDPDNKVRLFKNGVVWLLGNVPFPADLAVTKTVDLTEVTAGDKVTFSLTVANAGPGVANGVLLVDAVPESFQAEGSFPSQGDVWFQGGELWWGIGDLPAGASATMTVEGFANDPGAMTNIVIVSAASFDPDPANNHAAVVVQVAPANNWPQVKIVGPREGSVFPALATVWITAEATDVEGPVAEVRFYVSDKLIGTATTSPFVVQWDNAPEGHHVLTAVAVDSAGWPATSPPIQIDVFTRQPNNMAAIVRNFPAPEIEQLRVWLLGMGFGADVFDQEGLSLDALKNYSLVIWDDLSYQMGGISDNDVDVFHRLFELGAPLYFIGDDLAFSTGNLSSRRQEDWISLSHLGAGDNSGGGNWLTVVAPEHPVVNGPFGRVAEMAIGGDPDAARRTSTGEILLGQTTDADVLLAYESLAGGTRTLTQNFLATAGGDAENSRRLFQNGVHWLTQGVLAPPADLRVQKSAKESTSRLGEPVVFTITAANLGPATAGQVTVVDELPGGLEVTGVSASAGAWSQADGKVMWTLDALPAGESATMEVEGIARELGVLTNTVTIASSAPDLNPADNTSAAEVLVIPLPEPKADVEVVKLAAPDPVTVGSNLTYTVTVTNHGPDQADEVVLTDKLPDGVTLVSATLEGNPIADLGNVQLGSLAAEESASIEIIVTPTAEGAIRNLATVKAKQLDPVPANNTAVVDTTVKAAEPPPTIRISSIRVEDGKVYIEWTGGRGQLQRCANLAEPAWENVGLAPNSYVGPATGSTSFYRVVAKP